MTRYGVVVVLSVISAAANADTRLKAVSEVGVLSYGDSSAGKLSSLCDQTKKVPLKLFDACGPACVKRLTEYCQREPKQEGDGATSVPVASALSWQSSALNGLSSFIAERSKAEVINWAEGLISEHLCQLSSPPVPPATARDLWFHDTCVLFSDPQLAVQKSTAMIAATIRSDLLRLPALIIRWSVDKERQALGDATVQRLTHDAETASRVYASFRRGAAPLEIISGLGHDVDLRAQCVAGSKLTPDRVTPECALLLAGLVVERFGSVVSSTNVKEMTVVTFEDLFTKVFSGPSVCLALNEAFGVAAPPIAPAPAGTPPAAAAAPSLPPCELGSAIPAGLKRYAKLFELATDDPDFAEYKARLHRLAQSMVDFEAQAQNFKKSLGDPASLVAADGSLSRTADSFLAVVRAGLDLFDSKEGVENYAKAIDDVVEIGHLGLRLAAGDYMGAGAALLSLASADHLGVALPDSLRRFLAFTMDVASAKSSDDVQHAIEMAAAPVGGWKLKRQHLSLSLTAFAGAMGGYEWATRSSLKDGESKPGGGYAGGLFAPVGIDLAGPLCSAMSLGIFVSAVDVGQLTWSRLTDVSSTNATATITPNVDFPQVLSPGAYVHVGLGNSPFVFGAGFSFAPALRDYTIGAATTGTAFDEVRFGVFLAVDVTILPLWTAK